jgi:hypothetical protein
MTAEEQRNGPAEPAGARWVRDCGYDGCIELANAAVRVVLAPELGGRVASYRHGALEALHRNPALDGYVWRGGEVPDHPPGGRCDVGPEYGGLPRDEIWLGSWTAEIAGPRAARLTSPVAAGCGLQLVREFALAAEGSHLRCMQRIRNRGRATLHTFHWSRTFTAGQGIVVAPLAQRGHFPRGYATCPIEADGIVDFLPAPEPNVRVRAGFLEIAGPPRRRKFVFDVEPGWLACLAPAGLLFVKRYAVHPDRAYGDVGAANASIWYGPEMVEVEPIGPVEAIPPGGEASFTEDWWLRPFPWPADRNVDLARLRAEVDACRAE